MIYSGSMELHFKSNTNTLPKFVLVIWNPSLPQRFSLNQHAMGTEKVCKNVFLFVLPECSSQLCANCLGITGLQTFLESKLEETILENYESIVYKKFTSDTSHGISKIYYFTDGTASQYNYTNYKNICNLLYHRDDFGLDAEWHFFATSHGKNACDGIGGTVKRELQMPV